MTPLTQIHADGRVAERYGLEEAIFLHALMFWYRTNRGNNQNFHDGRWWTYNSVKAFEEIFPWWTAGQIRRVIARCREKGAMLTGSFAEDRRDRTAWYTPSDELLMLYGENVNCICTNQQMQSQEPASSDAEIDKCNIRNTWGNHGETDMTPYSPPPGDGVPAESKEGDPIEAQRSGFDGERRHSAANELSPQGEARDAQLVPTKDKPSSRPRRSRQKKSVPTHAPERFEQFWQAYPGGGSRLKAVEEWDKLAASPELLTEMARALKHQKASRMWQDGVGIPHAFRWLRDRRWTDKLPETPAPRDNSGGWAYDPEVSS